MADVVLTEQERDAMAHALGHRSAKRGSVNGGRNYYCAAADDPMWLSLVDRGLARSIASLAVGSGNAIFIVSPAGIAAVEADPRSQRCDRLYTVRFDGVGITVTVTAENEWKARYAAARDVRDELGTTVKWALRQITSCRLKRGQDWKAGDM